MKHTKIISVIFCFFCMCFQSNASTDGQIDSSNLFRNYIEEYGRLSLVGNQLYANGKSIQLKGWSTYTIDSCMECYTENAILKMKETGANVVRFAFPVNISLNSEKDKLFQNLYNYIDYAEKTGLFCVVDWHVEGGNPNNYYGENFLDSISLYVKKKNYKHVIYEICNEPGNIKWSEIKDYASRALSTIQYNDPKHIIRYIQRTAQKA